MAKDEEKTREWILERTTERFLSEGFSRFTMDEIARDAGVSKKTLYRLIPSKNTLIMMVLDRQISIIEMKHESILKNPDLDFQARLDASFRIVSEFYSRVQKDSIRDMAKFSPDVWEMIRRRRTDVLSGIVRLLEEGRDEGYIRSDIPPSFLGRYFHSIVDSLLTPRVMMDENMTPNRLLDITLSIFYKGILSTPGEVR